MSSIRIRTIASLLMGSFAAMRQQGIEAEISARAKKMEANKGGGDPHKKLRELNRKESHRWRGGGGSIPVSGKRQGERIAKQIAKGMLKTANGLESSSEKTA